MIMLAASGGLLLNRALSRLPTRRTVIRWSVAVAAMSIFLCDNPVRRCLSTAFVSVFQLKIFLLNLAGLVTGRVKIISIAGRWTLTSTR
jgi:hypothetical protein